MKSFPSPVHSYKPWPDAVTATQLLTPSVTAELNLHGKLCYITEGVCMYRLDDFISKLYIYIYMYIYGFKVES